MRFEPTLRALRWLLPPLLLAMSSSAWGQSSTNYALSPGAIGAGGSAGSTTYKLVGEAGGPRARSSSTNRDAVSGFVGGAYSSKAVVSLTTTAGVYKAVAFPVRSSPNTIGTVLEELGAYNAANWRFGRWSPPDSAYMEAGAAGSLLAAINVGEGYWLITQGVATVSDTGLPSPPGEFGMALLAGPTGRPAYNQVGNPFLFAVARADLRVTDGINTYGFMAVGNSLTEHALRVWDPGTQSYTDATVVDGRTSFFVKRLAPTGTVRLLFPYVASALGVPEPGLVKPGEAEWAVAVTARQGARGCEPLLLGAAPVAAGGWNPLCLSRAPSPPGGALSLGVSRPDWGRMSGEYVRVFEPRAESMSWEFVAQGAASPGELGLELRGLDLPAGLRLALTDLASGVTREVWDGQTVSFATAPGAHRFRLTATGAGGAPPEVTALVDGMRYAYPNPFRASSGLAFTLARGGDVRVGIYDVTGRRVRSLERLGAGPGEQVLVWDGRDGGGRQLAPGVYLARYQAGAAHGTRRLVKLN